MIVRNRPSNTLCGTIPHRLMMNSNQAHRIELICVKDKTVNRCRLAHVSD